MDVSVFVLVILRATNRQKHETQLCYPLLIMETCVSLQVTGMIGGGGGSELFWNNSMI